CLEISSILIARMRKWFFSNCSMMSPIAFLRTASGLTMVRVRCKVFIFELGVILLSVNFVSHGRGHGFANISLRCAHANTGSLHGFDLFRRGPMPTRNDRASMTHAASRRSSLAGDKTDH